MSTINTTLSTLHTLGELHHCNAYTEAYIFGALSRAEKHISEITVRELLDLLHQAQRAHADFLARSGKVAA